MVQITGSLDAAIKALTQVMLRLRANVFDMDRGLVLLPTFFPYVSQTRETSSKPRQHRKRENYSHGEVARDEDYGSQMSSNSPRRNRVY
jgi:poly(rC)-binding protein 2/3/4